MFYYGESTFSLHPLPNDFDSLAMITEIREENIDSDGTKRIDTYKIAFHNLCKLRDAIDNRLSQVRIPTDG